MKKFRLTVDDMERVRLTTPSGQIIRLFLPDADEFYDILETLKSGDEIIFQIANHKKEKQQ